jgi:hypothetical protein
MNVSSGTTGRLYFTTESDSTFDEEKSISFTINTYPGYRAHTLDMSSIPTWAGNITQLRIHPVNSSGLVEITSIRFISIDQ